MKQVIYISVIIFLVCHFDRAYSQIDSMRRWTLDDCITYALEHNIEIKQQESIADTKKIYLSESKWAYAPNISFSNGYSLSSGRVLDPTTYDFIENQTVSGNNTSISAGITLFGGMGNLHNLKRAQLDLKSSILGIEKIKNDITLNVIAYYLEVLGAQEAIHNAEQVVATLRIQEQKTAKLVEVKKVTNVDLLQIQSQLSDAQNEVLSAKNQLYIAKFNLCQLLEIEDYMSFETVIPNDAFIENYILPNDVMTVVDAANSLPQIQMAQLDINIAARNIGIARAAYYPTLSLSGAYGSSYSDARLKTFQNPDGTYRYEAYPFFDQYRDNANKYISLSLNVPIFNRFSARKNVQKQKVAMQQALYALRVIEKQVTKEVNLAYIDARIAWDKYLSSKKYIATASEAARQIEYKYNLGITTVIEYNISLNNLVNANTKYIQAKYEYIFKTKIVDFYFNH